MQKRLPKLMGATMLALLMVSFLVATPVRAVGAPPPGGVANPVWATVNALPQGNYPGANEIFDIFVVNSDQPPNGNVTLVNETLTAPALPADQQTNTAIGLPIMLSPGQAILNTITLPIPGNFTQASFTADLVAYVFYPNGTALKLTGSTQVFMLGLPGSGTQTTTSSSASQTTQSTQTTTQSGSVSTTLFAAGVAIPSIVVLILLILLVQRRGRPK